MNESETRTYRIVYKHPKSGKTAATVQVFEGTRDYPAATQASDFAHDVAAGGWYEVEEINEHTL